MKRRGADADNADLVAPPDAAERKKAKAVIAYRVDLLPKVDVPWWDGEMGMGDWRYPLNSMYIYIHTRWGN